MLSSVLGVCVWLSLSGEPLISAISSDIARVLICQSNSFLITLIPIRLWQGLESTGAAGSWTPALENLTLHDINSSQVYRFTSIHRLWLWLQVKGWVLTNHNQSCAITQVAYYSGVVPLAERHWHWRTYRPFQQWKQKNDPWTFYFPIRSFPNRFGYTLRQHMECYNGSPVGTGNQTLQTVYETCFTFALILDTVEYKTSDLLWS